MKKQLVLLVSGLVLAGSVFATKAPDTSKTKAKSNTQQMIALQMKTNLLLKESLETQLQILYFLRKHMSTGFM